MTPRLLAAIDFEAPPDLVVGHLATVARLHDAEVLLAHVLPSALKAWLSSGLAEKRVEERLGSWAARLEALGVRTSLAPVGRGSVSDGLLALAESSGAALVFAGAGAPTLTERVLSGATSRNLVRFCRQPVWLWRGERPGVRRVLAAIDGSECSGVALDRARALAKKSGAHLTVASVFDDPTAHPFGEAEADLQVRAEEHKALRSAELERFVAERGLDAAAAERRWLWGKPHDVLPTLASDEAFDLMVLGRSGLSGARRVLLGGTAERLALRSPCSLLVVG